MKNLHRLYPTVAALLGIVAVAFLAGLVAAKHDDDLLWAASKGLKPCSFKANRHPLSPNNPPRCDFVADFLIVGSGAGALPFARKLSDAGFSVVIFEAGDNHNDHPDVYEPTMMFNVMDIKNPTYGWQMRSEYEPVTGVPYYLSLGRLFGGSTSHNGMQYVRGSKAYFDLWASLVGSNWTSAAILAAYQQMETYTTEECVLPPNATACPPVAGRGTSGLFNVRRPASGPAQGAGSMANKLAKWAAEASGIPITPDYNGVAQPFGPYQRYDVSQTPDRKRESAATAFLGEDVVSHDGFAVGNRKIRVVFRATVTRLLIENKRVKGIEYVRDGITERAWCRKEVALGASVFSTQILQLSGIGDATLLQSLNISVVYNNPNVGRHLANHANAFLPFAYNKSDLPMTAPNDPQSMFAGGMFMPSFHANGTFNPADLNGPRAYQQLWLDFGIPDTIICYVMLARPKSTGYDLIQSKDPLQIPLHNELTYTNPDDLEDFARTLFYFFQNKLAVHMETQDPSYKPLWPHWNTVNDARNWLLANTAKAYHYCGQNRMALSPADGVVDYAGRVFGVQGVRVVDTTAIPTIPDGNTAAVASMLGFRLADFVIQQYS